MSLTIKFDPARGVEGPWSLAEVQEIGEAIHAGFVERIDRLMAKGMSLEEAQAAAQAEVRAAEAAKP